MRFERLADEGRAALAGDDPARPPSSCDRRWRCGAGPALAISPTSGSRRTRSRGSRSCASTAVEERIDADLRLGRHVELVAELEGLVREHPLRERLRAQHMLALYRSGRQADALESLRDARRSLVDELGLEPGRELRELEQAILAQDPALDAPRAVRAGAPPAGRRRGVALIAAGAALAGAVAAVAMALNASGRRRCRAARLGRRDRPRERVVVADVPVGARPEAIAADGGSIWVANVADGTVSQIDSANRRVVATIRRTSTSTGSPPMPVRAWIADSGRGRAVRLDADIGTVADSVRFPTRAGSSDHRRVLARPRLPLGAERAARRGLQARDREQARERARRCRQQAGRDRGR